MIPDLQRLVDSEKSFAIDPWWFFDSLNEERARPEAMSRFDLGGFGSQKMLPR
jgi:hypothetical protein